MENDLFMHNEQIVHACGETGHHTPVIYCRSR